LQQECIRMDVQMEPLTKDNDTNFGDVIQLH
jgi:hypothetical protein